jgi:general secretion pathway protein D
MFESRSRVVLLALLTVVGAAASAQPPEQAPAPVPLPGSGPPGQAPVVTMIPQPGQPVAVPVTSFGVPPEVQIERARRRDEASVDIEELIAQVAASTGKEFFVDPRVRARVLAVPALEDPTYADLLSVLRLHGYIAVEIDGKVNVLPDANARSMPTRMLQRDDASVPDDEVVTRVISVPGNNAANLVPILRPLLPQSAHLAAMVEGDQSRKLIVVDTYANVRRITALVETLGQ